MNPFFQEILHDASLEVLLQFSVLHSRFLLSLNDDRNSLRLLRMPGAFAHNSHAQHAQSYSRENSCIGNAAHAAQRCRNQRSLPRSLFNLLLHQQRALQHSVRTRSRAKAAGHQCNGQLKTHEQTLAMSSKAFCHPSACCSVAKRSVYASFPEFFNTSCTPCATHQSLQHSKHNKDHAEVEVQRAWTSRVAGATV